MIIREYVENDFERTVEILKSSFPEISEKISKSLVNSADLNLDKSHYIQLVAVVDDIVVGYAIVTRCNDFILKRVNFWIDYVCVDVNFRGRGIARALLMEIERLAVLEKVLYLQMTSSRFRSNARKLYIDLGYEIRESDIFRKVLSWE